MPWNNQGGGPWGSGPKGPWGSGPQSSGPTPPDLEEFLRRGQDKLRSVMPGGSLGGRGVFLIAILAFMFWVGSGIYFVQPDELGVVLRFGEYVRDAQPGANYHLPYPIETALTPKVTRVNRIDIGMRVVEDARRGGSSVRDVPEESLMLTGDENIVDVDFSVFWVVKAEKGASQYLFNIQNPEGTVKAVAESAMREAIGRTELQPILTGGKTRIEAAVAELMQKTLDNYQAGVQISQVQMQKVDPPAQTIDAFREVQAARIGAESAQNEAQAYANRVIPDARGRSAGAGASSGKTFSNPVSSRSSIVAPPVSSSWPSHSPASGAGASAGIRMSSPAPSLGVGVSASAVRSSSGNFPCSPGCVTTRNGCPRRTTSAWRV